MPIHFAQCSLCSKAKYLALVAFVISFASVTSSLVAQEPPAAATPAADTSEAGPTNTILQRVLVTGYLVPRIGTGPAPVVTLDQDYISRQGDQTVADVILRLPQNRTRLRAS
jgi:hypothetical protein